MKIKKEELKKIIGGISWTTIANTIVRGVNTFVNLGRTVGSAVRRIKAGKLCSI